MDHRKTVFKIAVINASPVTTQSCVLTTLRGNLWPLPGDKILGLPKLKAFADDKSNVTQNIKVCV